eukprot:Protomagalhaensia_wolfi_Nauph_80__4535@NODE_465_length_2471_cov_76_023438_g233_i2_p1_GENE_NODE_465_length_2471_cov_76_023438_g233_i2NODE_465_length_2471_cov_76_023438_g233_i2_p1_ORF_typecomplete_len464_score83_08Hydrolase_4/PF12146_8/1_8e02Hydrolase_4/PF12146_8/6_6e29Abhydrolase_6/PF12697_7/8_4e06Abhydrolase_1/PF00561_20/0_00016DUF1100/PF06500_11/0_00011Abhydrolase_3/PF07859_13/0_0032DUF2048/PF09752_9/0_01FSH1/PF03959_13/6_7e03FSH1/PF03959_13/0_038Peptidase_S15/PF02129_18/0_028Abhydrolase_7/PF12
MTPSSTLSKAKFLFAKLHATLPGDAEPLQQSYRHWLEFVTQHQTKIESFYGEDGLPAVLAFRGRNGTPVCGYRWAPEDALLNQEGEGPATKLPENWLTSSDWCPINWERIKGVVFFCHGITESARFSLLNLKLLEKKIPLGTRTSLGKIEESLLKKVAALDDSAKETYERSWAQTIVNAGYVLYALDMQGHGLSQSWRCSRCNVEKFDHYVEDTLSMITTLHSSGEWRVNVPMVVSGLSMGGCIATRVVQEAFNRRLLRTCKLPSESTVASSEAVDPACRPLPALAGLLLFCPALSVDRLKRKPINRVLFRIGHVVSKYLPTARLAALNRPEQFPWLVDVLMKDPLVHTKKLPARLAWETIQTMERVFPDAHLLPHDMGVCVIQSKSDTMTDPEGSETFLNMISCNNIHRNFLDYGWHFLPKEPGHSKTIALAVRFLDSVCQDS